MFLNNDISCFVFADNARMFFCAAFLIILSSVKSQPLFSEYQIQCHDFDKLIQVKTSHHNSCAIVKIVLIACINLFA